MVSRKHARMTAKVAPGSRTAGFIRRNIISSKYSINSFEMMLAILELLKVVLSIALSLLQ